MKSKSFFVCVTEQAQLAYNSHLQFSNKNQLFSNSQTWFQNRRKKNKGKLCTNAKGLTSKQRALLEEAFDEQRFPDIFRHEELAKQLHATDATIQVCIYYSMLMSILPINFK